MKRKAIIINGFGGSGKDTFIDILKERRSNCEYQTRIKSYSSVAVVKEAAKILGWDGESKTEKDRRFLYDLKKLVTEYNDGCLKYMQDKYTFYSEMYEKVDTNILVFFHIREPEEINKAKEALDAIVIYVKNDNVARNEHNLEDRDIENYPYDYIVNNSGTLEDLKLEADKFFDWIQNNYLV